MSLVPNYYELIPKKFKRNSKYYNPNPGFMIHPFQLALIGPTGSGKTNLILAIIDQCACFDKIYLFTKNLDEPLYAFLIRKLGERIHATSDLADLPRLKGVDVKQTKGKGKAKREQGRTIRFLDEDGNEENSDEEEESEDDLQKLIIFDDCVLDDKKAQKKIATYFTFGRKQNFSAAYLSQSYWDIPKIIRVNCNYIILKQLRSRSDKDMIIREHRLGIESDVFRKMLEFTTRDKDSFFMIDMVAGSRDPNKRFRYGFNHSFKIE